MLLGLACSGVLSGCPQHPVARNPRDGGVLIADAYEFPDAEPHPDVVAESLGPTWLTVQPIVQVACGLCHGRQPVDGLASYVDYEDFTTMVRPLAGGGQPQPGYVLANARMHASGRDRMPPPASPVQLWPEELALFETWVALGAPLGAGTRRPDGGARDGADVAVGSGDGPDAGVGLDRATVDDDLGGSVDGSSGASDAGAVDGGAPARNPLVGVGPPVRVSYNFALADGVVWRPANVGTIADIFSSQMFSLTAPGLVVMPTGAATGQNAGLANEPGGGLLGCQQAARAVVRYGAGSQPEVVADRWNGLRFSSPNDVVVRADGTIYLTDPPYGLLNGRARDIPFNGLFRVTATGSVAVERRFPVGTHTGTVSDTLPNGLELSPDERTLYVGDARTGIVYAFDVEGDGALSNERVFAVVRGTSPDGMTVDALGNLLVATSQGIEAYAPDGMYWGTLPVLRPYVPVNVAFGGPSHSYLIVTAGSAVFVYPMSVPGLSR